ncbi:glycosyltransferase [Massilimicrobiota timonensis]|uniref:glycosyltransferase n=1 Tax=Massilimicrobiota timonensis TaxID=1776392 RepID=UPI00101BAFEC|nr:glycosyltransferase [Massilimicrobiota timonensis]
MRVLFLRSNPVNPDSRVEKEVETLIKNGYKVDIFCWDRNKNYPTRKENKKLFTTNCNIYRVGIQAEFGAGFKKNILPLLQFQFEIIKFLKKNKSKYSIIHACDFDTGLSSYCFKKNSKFIYDVFDYYADSFSVPKFLKNIIYKIEDYICNHADILILCNEDRINQIHKLKQNNICVIHNSPMKLRIHEFGYEFSNNIKIAYIGILGETRMIKDLIHIVNKFSFLELHIAGFGPLENYIKNASLKNERIIFYGKIPYEETLYIEKNCDIIPAIYDPNIRNHIFAAPNKFYESLFLGKPTIMINGTGMSKVVKDKQTGLVIQYNEMSLEKAILDISKNIDYWRKKQKEIKLIYDKYYSWEIMMHRLLSTYDQLFSRRSINK